MVSAQARRRQVDYARQRGLSARRACALLSVARSTLGYESRLADALPFVDREGFGLPLDAVELLDPGHRNAGQ